MVDATRKNWLKEFLQKILKVFRTIIRSNSLKFVKRWCYASRNSISRDRKWDNKNNGACFDIASMDKCCFTQRSHIRGLPVSQALDLTAWCCFPFVHAHFLLSIVCENNLSEYIKLKCIFTYKNKRYGHN